MHVTHNPKNMFPNGQHVWVQWQYQSTKLFQAMRKRRCSKDFLSYKGMGHQAWYSGPAPLPFLPIPRPQHLTKHKHWSCTRQTSQSDTEDKGANLPGLSYTKADFNLQYRHQPQSMCGSSPICCVCIKARSDDMRTAACSAGMIACDMSTVHGACFACNCLDLRWIAAWGLLCNAGDVLQKSKHSGLCRHPESTINQVIVNSVLTAALDSRKHNQSRPS